jgi:hypothetical protein
MTPGQFQEHLRRRPFEPFRFYLTDGSKYAVRHPENAIVSHMGVAIGVEPFLDDLPHKLVYCDPLHIVRVEPLKNGKKKKKKDRGK